MPWVHSASEAEIQYTLVVHFVKAGRGPTASNTDLHRRIGAPLARELGSRSPHTSASYRTDGQLNLRDTFHNVAAWKVAREVCASLKQSRLMRLFVPENLPMVEPARLLSILGPWCGLDCGAA
jgi:hypothetical protein